MELIADILLISGALGSCFYCFILARRLKRFNSLENGVGGAVAVLSAQVDDLEKILLSAQTTASSSAESLEKQTAKAEAVSRQLELHIASLHDVVPTQKESPVKTPSINTPPTEKEPTPPETPPKAAPATSAEPMFVRHSQNGDA